jgi:benzoyl-CoA reductase subunit C
MAVMTDPDVQSVVEDYRYVIEDRDFPSVRAWKDTHPSGKVVGCFPVYTPVELIHACGMLPAGIIGGGNQIEIAHADARFQSFICSVIKSTLELGMTSKLDIVDCMLFNSICDPARNLASVFKRNFPELTVEFIHYPQNPGSPSAQAYLESEYGRVLGTFSALSGTSVTDADIAESIQAYNRLRGLLRELYALRAAAPEKVSTTHSYILTRAATLLPVEDATALLERALAHYRLVADRPKDRVRVLLVGAFCEQPPLDLIESLEQSGCYILEDDFLLGWRFFSGDVSTYGCNPLRGLADAYLNHSVHSSIKHDLRQPRARQLVDRVKALNADAVVFLGAKFCEPALFDYALYRRALEEHGIRHLFLEFEEKMWLFDRVRSEVETFVESMLFD